MKKIFGLMLLCATLLGFTSCGNDEDDNNPLKGTLWSYEDNEKAVILTRYVEFFDDRYVKIWDTHGGGPYIGKYEIMLNTIYFDELYNAFWGQYYITGKFTDRSLTVYYSYKYNPNSGEHGELYNDVFTKE